MLSKDYITIIIWQNQKLIICGNYKIIISKKIQIQKYQKEQKKLKKMTIDYIMKILSKKWENYLKAI